mgnify:CR=1 FL=1
MEGKSADDDPRSGAADDEAGSSSDEILMSTLAHLEDLLMDTVTFGDEDEDEEWNASNSKHNGCFNSSVMMNQHYNPSLTLQQTPVT